MNRKIVDFSTHKAVYPLMSSSKAMMPILFKCPICHAVLANPAELREHRLEKHKNCMHEAKIC
jgi:hypothetical protein